MVSKEIRAIIESKAQKYNLYPDLVEAHVMTESSGNVNAWRYEPAFYKTYIQKLGIKNATESAGRATSWGLLQIMGQVARELGYQGSWEGLCDPTVNLEYGCKKLSKCYQRYHPELDKGIAAYNSGSAIEVFRDGKPVLRNQEYVDRVHKFWDKIRTENAKLPSA
jgi:soluble lytic murein transglycosylase-like protein